MRGFGDQLKETREARGVTIEAVAKATRIAPRNLEALERSDLEGLPRGPFGKGYIRAYAEFLGIDAQPILEAYHSQERQRGLGPSATQRRTLDELSQLMQKRSQPQRHGLVSPPLKWGAQALVALFILGGAGWLLIDGETPAESVATPAPSAGQASPEADTIPEPSEADVFPESTPQETRQPERPAPVPAPKVGASIGELRVSHSGVGTGVENHRLVGRADRFVEGTIVAFWTRVLGGEPGDVILHIWSHEGDEVMRAELEIGSSHWRTFSRRSLPEGSAGRWVAEARSPDGRVLAREEFLCVSDEP
jgi:cytoskeletal protein RodZ